ncbi:hypothetical protein [Ferruginibacter albus]|uniref:hypothetical protein n=1 Tax=Ferruginibacter albus TaxID=2875540 RepID=UPI001CC6D290|nr:hypothetical protein [Ferruginibacter albus]UAY53549.1 hypothetical protein K9M53_07745 [Ferruginibacter albus]
MRTPLLILSAIIVLTISSCSKSDNPANLSARIKTYSETVTSNVIGNSADSFLLSYNSDGQLVSMSSIPHPPAKIAYVYGANDFKMTITGYDNTNLYETVFLKGSLIDSTFQYDDDGGSADTTTEKYFYNGNNQLFQLNTYYYYFGNSELDKSEYYVYDAAGNVIKDSTAGGQVITYEYYLDKTLGVDVSNLFNPFFASFKSLNLVKSKTTKDSYSDEVVISNSTYTFDANNRVETETQTITENGNPAGTAIRRFTYY